MFRSMHRLFGPLPLAVASLLLLAHVGHAQVQPVAPSVETLITTTRFGDMEFDWGRDGVYCAQCNHGRGNARFNWVDRQNRLWIGYIEFESGFIYPPNGRGEWVDIGAAYYSDFGNGPEWVFSKAGSQLIYTRYAPGVPITPETTGIGLATMVNGSWTASFIDGGLGRISPGPSQSIDDETPMVTYASGTGPLIYWRELSDPIGRERTAPWIGVGLSVRWVTGTSKLAFVNGVPHPSGGRYQQVLVFDTATRKLEQLTFDATEKRGVFMFEAPELGGDMVFITVAARTEMRVYRLVARTLPLEPVWTLVKTIRAPDETPFIATPEPFIHNGKTYVYMTASSSKRASDVTVPTHLALTGIDPAVDDFRMLTNELSPVRLRQDPEYFITAQGPFLYFTRAVPGTETSSPVNEGVFRIDLGLGPRRP